MKQRLYSLDVSFDPWDIMIYTLREGVGSRRTARARNCIHSERISVLVTHIFVPMMLTF